MVEAWAKKYIDIDVSGGEWLIEYGVNVLTYHDYDDQCMKVSYNFWARATYFPTDRYMPIFVNQVYNNNPRELFKKLYRDMRVRLQSYTLDRSDSSNPHYTV